MRFTRVLHGVIPFVCAFVGTVAQSQSDRTATTEIFHKRFFVSYQVATLTGVPVVRAKMSNQVPGAPITSDGTSGSAFGAGVSFVGNGRWLAQLAYDRAQATFDTWLDPGRTIAFNSMDITVGYALSTSQTVSVVPYFTFAPGWLHQSSWNDPRKFDIHDTQHLSSYENLQDTDYTTAFALGAKVGLLKYFAFTAELRQYSEDTGGSACGGDPNCIDLTDRERPKDWATRTSVGLQVYFGRMGKR